MKHKPVLELINITKTFREGSLQTTVLSQISLALRPQEVVALIGPSGCGKSTTLHIAGLLDIPSGGDVVINGESAQGLKDKQKSYLRLTSLGFVFQFHHLLEEFSVLENVMMPLRIAGNHDKKSYARDLLEKVGMWEKRMCYPSILSGGEKQRVAIARSLVQNPPIILADEPTGNLDEENSQNVFNIFMDLVKYAGCSVLLVTHNLALTSKAHRVYTMKKGILETGA